MKDQKDATVLWADYEDLDWDRILEGGHPPKANSYLVRKGLTRKAQLAYQLKKYTSKRPQSALCQAVPETLTIETWEAFEEEMSFGTLGGATFDSSLTATLSQKDRLEWCLRDVKERINKDKDAGKLWILKPSVSNKGAEVTVVKEYETVQEVVGEWPDVREWVLQAYVDKPLLYRRKKFHLRTYVLAVGDLSVYVWRKILLLSSAMEYDRQDISNPLAHITNTARQVEGDDNDIYTGHNIEAECVHLLDDLVEDLQQDQGMARATATAVVESIRTGICEVTGELFKALHGERTVFSPMPHCFELMGLDFLVTLDEKEKEKGSGKGQGKAHTHTQVHLLEVNPGPDFKQTGPRLRCVIGGLLEMTLDMAVLGKYEEGTEDMQLVYRDHHAAAGMGGEGGGMRLLDG